MIWEPRSYMPLVATTAKGTAAPMILTTSATDVIDNPVAAMAPPVAIAAPAPAAINAIIFELLLALKR